MIPVIVIPSDGRCPVASSQQQQVVATGKSIRARSILPSVSLYCVSVWQLTRPTLLDCLTDILFVRKKCQDRCDTKATPNNGEFYLLNFPCVGNLNNFEIGLFHQTTFWFLINLSSGTNSSTSGCRADTAADTAGVAHVFRASYLSYLALQRAPPLTYTTHLAPPVCLPGADWLKYLLRQSYMHEYYA